jgi:hypothetical protein
MRRRAAVTGHHDLTRPDPLGFSCLVVLATRYKTMTQTQRKWLKRKQAIEPEIGHLKADHRMERNWLKGSAGDALHTLCCAVGYNIKWLMRAISRLGLQVLLLGLDLLTQLGELERNISKQIKFQFANRNLNIQVLQKF